MVPCSKEPIAVVTERLVLCASKTKSHGRQNKNAGLPPKRKVSSFSLPCHHSYTGTFSLLIGKNIMRRAAVTSPRTEIVSTKRSRVHPLAFQLHLLCWRTLMTFMMLFKLSSNNTSLTSTLIGKKYCKSLGLPAASISYIGKLTLLLVPNYTNLL
jgi:hypothetical protein